MRTVFLVTLLACGLCLSAHAEMEPSIMSGNLEPDFVKKPEISATSLSEDCTALSKDIKKLSGKPLRKAAAMERYKADCETLYNQE